MTCSLLNMPKSAFQAYSHECSTHYGFTAEELDFILNYDTRLRLSAVPAQAGRGFGRQVKYRPGRDTGEELE
jgi:hypothetical protein